MKRTPLKRKSPLRRVSKKRKVENMKYGRLRNAYLRNHPRCEACIPLGYAEAMPASEIHHKAGRGINLNEVRTFMAVCRPCHTQIHNNARTARRLGLIK